MVGPLVELFRDTKKPFEVVVECFPVLRVSLHYCCLCAAHVKYCLQGRDGHRGGVTQGSTFKVPFQRRRQGHNVLALLPFQTKLKKTNKQKKNG